MEVIRLSGYTEDEKINIAQRYLVPKQMKNNGLKARASCRSPRKRVRDIVRYYTREAGVRSLEREISKVCRKVVAQLVLKSRTSKVVVNARRTSTSSSACASSASAWPRRKTRSARSTGLAWTEVGGELLTIEAVQLPGKGKVVTTGKLGEVMQESIQAALSVVRGVRVRSASTRTSTRRATSTSTCRRRDPQGRAVGGHRDLDRAGVGADRHPGALRRRDDRRDHLRGEVLAIGGLKEKLLAAVRGGIRTALIPEENVRISPRSPTTSRTRSRSCR